MAKRKIIEDELRMKIDGFSVGIVTLNEALKYILLELNSQIEYMNVDGIRVWLEAAFDQINEILTWKKNASMAKRIHSYEEFLLKLDTKMKLMKFVNEIILSLDGLGTLRNFYSNNGRNNAEKMALRDVKY